MSRNWKEKIICKRNWWIDNQPLFSSFLVWVFLSSSSFFSSSIGSFEIGESDDIHVKVKIHLIIDTKE